MTVNILGLELDHRIAESNGNPTMYMVEICQSFFNAIDELQGTGGGIPDAPMDGSEYVRQNAAWVINSGGSFAMDILELTQTTMQQHDTIADLAIEWKTQDSTSANFTHSTTTNSHQITCVNAGWLDVRYAILYDQDDTGGLNTEAYITLNGTRVEKSVSRKSYYAGLSAGKYGDESRAFYLQVAASDVIELHSGVTDGNNTFTLARNIDTVPTMTNIQIRYLG